MSSATDPLYLATAPHALREYAVIADGTRGALIGPRGDVCFMCMPAWHDAAIFASLVGGRGVYSITPTDRFVWGGYYEPVSLIWRSRWVTVSGIVECREALALPAERGTAVLLRQIRVEQGVHELRIVLDPAHGFGTERFTRVRRDDDGIWTGRTGDCWVRWQGAGDATVEHAGGRTRLGLWRRMHAGEQHDLVLELSMQRLDDEPVEAAHAWRATEAAWREISPDCSRTAAPRDAAHACAVLAGLSAPSGGTVAAATTSLPERADQGRNYDYRYVWCRDQSYIGHAAAAVGATSLLDGSVSFMRDRLLSDGDHVAPAYTIDGDPVPDEHETGVPGYPGGSDIAGNHVNAQFQLDVFGEALLLLAVAHGEGRLDEQGWRAAEIAAGAIERRWQEPDAGVWELDSRAWTHSRLICAAGLRRISACEPSSRLTSRWLSLADRIVADTSAHSLHPSGRWQRAPDDARVDASLLLPALRGAVPHDDPRSVETLDAVLRDLTQDGFVYRYRADGAPLGDAEGAFLLCGFWLSLAELQQGATLQAMRWFDRTRTACGPSGLLAEEFDVQQRQLRGNVPQAFVHALLAETAAALGAALE